MSVHPTITAALADQHRRDMITCAEAHRIAQIARAGRPAPAYTMRIIPQLIAAARRPVTRLLPVKALETAPAA